jgi:hypothetical protein
VRGSQQCTCGPVPAFLRKRYYQSYGRYDVNGVRFRSTIFEASRPLVATTITGVVMRVIDEGHKTKYYRITKHKTIFFNCDWFDPNHGIQGNQFGMVEVKHVDRLSGCDLFILAHQVEQVYYMLYPCQKLSAWWVVYKVNPQK